MQNSSNSRSHTWAFFTNHLHVLISLAGNPDKVLREVAIEVGITERNVQRIVAELEEAGVLTREREGRRNHYKINRLKSMRHTMESHMQIGSLLDFILKED